MYRIIANVGRVIRSQLQNTGWKSGTKDDVRKSKNGIILHKQADVDLIIKSRYSSFDEENYHSGPERDQKHWYNPDDYWFRIQNNNSSLEALGWGAAVVLGIHLKPLASFIYNSKQCQPALCPSVLLAFGTPVPPSEAKSTNTDTESLPQDDLISTLKKEFSHLFDQYRGSHENAVAGQLMKKRNITDAIMYWKRASLRGCSAAQYNLALCYEQGIGVSQNTDKALKFYKMAASNNHPVATYNLALLYAGDREINQSSESWALMEQAARLGIPEAQLYIGVQYTKEPFCDMEKAFYWLELAAQQNSADAQYMCGICYEHGFGVQQNACKAVDLYNKASLQGHSQATYNLAVMHQYGYGGLPESKSAARELYMKSTSQGCTFAQQSLDSLDFHNTDEDQCSLDETHRYHIPTSESSPVLYSESNDMTQKVSCLYDFIYRLKDRYYNDRSDGKRPTFYIGQDDDDEDSTLNNVRNESGKLTRASSLSCLPDHTVVSF